jgi:hypothetical protein
MPPVLIYTVDFSNGNLTPSLDVNGWGAMQMGNSGAAEKPESYHDSKGLTLSVFRSSATPPAHDANQSVSVMLGNNVLPVASRLLLRTEFDRPWAQQTYIPLTPTNNQTAGSNTTQAGAPWAVGIGPKFGGVNDTPADKRVPVTCQFNNVVGNGVRLNTPGSLQSGATAPVDSPLDYANYWPANPGSVFTLEQAYSGIKPAARPAGNGHVVGCGYLTIGNRNDQRVFSNEAFSGAGAQAWIDALGVSIVTTSGVGQISARLRSFSVSIWL